MVATNETLCRVKGLEDGRDYRLPGFWHEYPASSKIPWDAMLG